jgi:hypothetical protein
MKGYEMFKGFLLHFEELRELCTLHPAVVVWYA